MPTAANGGFRIQGGRLVDDNGQSFVMRGVSYPFTWFTGRYPAQTQQDFTNIANTRANAVRIVLSTGTGGGLRTTGAQLVNLIQWCKDRRMIAVLKSTLRQAGEIHSESQHITECGQLLAQLGRVQCRFAGQENFVIINIANEPFGNNSTGELRQRHDCGDSQPAHGWLLSQPHGGCAPTGGRIGAIPCVTMRRRSL